MDNFLPNLTFIFVVWLGVMVARLYAELKEIKILLDEILESSRRTDNNY